SPYTPFCRSDVRRPQHVRIAIDVWRLALLAAVAAEVDEIVLVFQPLHVERDAHAVGGAGSPVAVQRRVGCRQVSGHDRFPSAEVSNGPIVVQSTRRAAYAGGV